MLFFLWASCSDFLLVMAGRGRSRGGRGRGGVALGEGSRRAGDGFEREHDDGDWEGFTRGRPAPRLGYGDGDEQERRGGGQGEGDEQERRGGRRSHGCGVPASTAAQVSDLNPTHLAQGLGRGSEDCGRRGRGRGVGTVRPQKGKILFPRKSVN